jgi:parvulin-like peptidyl-prolyl isomerase
MRRLSLLLLAALLALLVASCGGGGGDGGSISKGDAAVVGGDHITRADLDQRVNQAKCSYDLQKRAFPKAGSPEYQAIQSQILQSLVQRAQLQQKAPSLGATVTDKQVERQLKQIKQKYFGGSEKRYRAELKRQCVSDPEVRSDIRANLLSDAIYKKVTASAKVTDAEANAYYLSNSVNYARPQSRVVRHILVKDKKTADRLYAQLKGGGDFAALAKKYSQDPGSKVQGGRLTISRGQTVAQFDRVAFALKTGELSKPVKTQFGWHIIQALKNATPRRATPFAQVKESIKQQLLQQKRSGALQRWLNGVKTEFASKTSYAAGLAPAPTTSAPTTTG